jgi:hypothetical protein
MNGATADDSEKMIRIPTNNRNIIKGNNHHFFRAARKLKSSADIASLLIAQNLSNSSQMLQCFSHGAGYGGANPKSGEATVFASPTVSFLQRILLE